MLSLTSVVLCYNLTGEKSTRPAVVPCDGTAGAVIVGVCVLLIVKAVQGSKGETTDRRGIVGSLDEA